MSLEAASYISELSASNPTSSDLQSQGDDHLRMIKSVLQTTFPNASRAFRFTDPVTEKVADYTVVSPDDENKIIPISASGAARTITFPTTSLFDGLSFVVIKTDSSVNPVTCSTAALINGAATHVLRHQYDATIFWYNLADTTWNALVVNRGFVAPVSVAANTTIDITHHKTLLQVSASAAARTITLPSTLPAGFKMKIRKSDTTANAVTLDATSGGNINGAATLALQTPYETHEIEFDGTTWTCPVYDSVPPGATMMWWFDTAPTGWTHLEGQAISRTGNPRLFAQFSTTYGVGDGSTTFNLPDPRGRFPRVWDHAAGNDPDAGTRTAPAGTSITAGDHIGTHQGDQVKNHTHTTTALPSSSLSGQAGGAVQVVNALATPITSSNPSGGGSENRVINFNIGMIIKLG